MLLIFVFWNISVKVCNNACIMPRFGENNFDQSLLCIFKWMILIILLVTFCKFLVNIKPEFAIQSVQY